MSSPRISCRCSRDSFQLPPEFLTSGESLLLRFHTDDTIHSKGFSLAYQALEANDDEQVIRKDSHKGLQRTSSGHPDVASVFRRQSSRYSQPWRMG